MFANSEAPNAGENRENREVVFTFDAKSFEDLKRMTEEAGFRTMAETIRESLRLTKSLENHFREGFKEVSLRNPETNRERRVSVPFVARLTRS
jgi:hypothetical protein